MLILFEILTNDEMQNDASDMLQFLLLKYNEIVEIRWKSWLFGSFWVFFVYALLHPMLHPNILANEDI